MESKIVGRQEERQKLDTIMQSKEAEFVAVYGRRRVGKTFLIREYLSKHMAFDFTGEKDADLNGQLANFFTVYLKYSKRKLQTTPPTTWRMAFTYLTEYIYTLDKKRKWVIFLDEMPWLNTPRSGFVSALEFFWNQYIGNRSNIVLIACGSSTSWIKKYLLNATGGLYNRVTRRIELHPFTLKETELFLQKRGHRLSRYQIIELYLALGGIPHYLKELEKGYSSQDLINRHCFNKKGLLYSEFNQLYAALFKNSDAHIAIVESLAAKHYGLTRTELAKMTKLPEGTLSRAIEDLIDCNFILQMAPYGKSKKDGLYKLADFYTLFYIKYIRDNKGNRWQDIKSKPSYTAWSGYAFENICLTHLDQIKAALSIGGVTSTVYSWRTKPENGIPGSQIDFIIERNDNIIHLCEVKFSNDSYYINKAYCEKLRLRRSIFTQLSRTKKVVQQLFISTYGAIDNTYFQQEIDNEITMDQLFI